MAYASLRSFSYFTFTLNQLLTPDTRECLYKNMGFTQILILMQVCRLWNLPLCNHCTPVCTKLSHVSNETLYLFSTNREGTCTSLSLAGHGSAMGFSLRKGRKRYLKVDHGWPWFGKAFLNHSQPWLTMVWQSFSKPWSTMVNHRFVKWHLSQPWLPMVGKSIVNHG